MTALPIAPQLDLSEDGELAMTPSGSRVQLQKALLAALAEGPSAVGQQVQYILSLSRANRSPAVETAYAEKSISVEHARLLALAQTADSLPESRIKRLLRQALRLSDPVMRLQIIMPLALHLPSQHYQSIIRDIWIQARHIVDPVVRARLLFQISPLLTLAQDEPATPGVLMDVLALAQAINNHEARIRSLVALAPHLPPAVQVRVLTRVLDEIDRLRSDTASSNTISAMAEHLPESLLERVLRSAALIRTPMDQARALTALARYLPDEHLVSLRAETLTAISKIDNEDARAEALIAFAPHLEYAAQERDFPVLLEQALGMAISMTRRQNRARALVAMAPQLTLDLKGEALAAVHNLSDERERAALLALLAPNLPQDILVASLAVAHTMREQDARVHALTVLAHHLPPSARQRTALDALAAAANLSHHFERVTALLALVDILDEPLHERALVDALETARLIKNENTRARALNHIAAHLPPFLLSRALENAAQLQNLQLRINTLTLMAGHMPADQRHVLLNDLLDQIGGLRVEYKRARALVSAAPLLPPDLLLRGLAMAEAIHDPYDRVSALIAFAQNAPPEIRPAVVAKAWTQIKNIENGYDHASSLAAIAPLLPDTAKEDLSRRSGMVIGGIMDEYDQASAISILAPLFSSARDRAPTVLPTSYTALKEGLQIALRVPYQALRVSLVEQGVSLWADLSNPDQSYTLWKDIALDLATLPLADVLLCLGIVMKIVRNFSGDAGLHEIARILGMR